MYDRHDEPTYSSFHAQRSTGQLLFSRGLVSGSDPSAGLGCHPPHGGPGDQSRDVACLASGHHGRGAGGV